MSDSIGVTLLTGIFKTTVFVYDLVTLPVYFVAQRPWIKNRLRRETRAVRLKADDPRSGYVRTKKPPPHSLLNCNTVPQLFKNAVEMYGDRPCVGQREVFGEELETQSDGKQLQKLKLGDYKWLSYKEMDQRIEVIAKGLMAVGLKPGDVLMIFAETRLEWYLTAQAVFRIGATIATLYTTLGSEGIVHGLNETKVSHMVTTTELLPKIKELLPKVPALKCVIYFESFKKAETDGFNLTLYSFSQVEEKGRSASDSKFVEAKPNDAAVIMYTSGSTGIPKGVVIMHINIIGTVRGLFAAASDLTEKHVYMAFLPLAHVLELAAESFFISVGVTIGYSSPNTMLNKSTAIKSGTSGDAMVLRPTVMAVVPLVLDRIRKMVCEEVGKKGSLYKSIFNFLIDYKKFWTKKGYDTPIINFLICRKIKHLFGGRLQYIVSGSAPLAPDTQEFIRSCLNVVVIQGYGLTETAAGATCMDFNDSSVGRVGPPLHGLQIKLQDWAEGNYSVNDKPNPRGEIMIGGDCVAAGYFQNEKLTNESFKEENGVRWFLTGDIGEIHADGCIKIIDRKKDLVKLQFGEYISLGKVESELKQSPFVDNICVYGDSRQTYVVALVVPNQAALKELAKQLGKINMSWEDLCNDPQVNEAMLKKLEEHGKKAKLHKTEIPAKISLCADAWTPESGLATAAMKIRRKNIEQKYKDIIETMYSSKPKKANESV